MADGVAGIQARIQEIQQRFAPQPASKTSATAAKNQTFAEMLSAAASLGTDGTGDGATASSPLEALLTGLTGTSLGGLSGSGSLLGPLGSTGTTGTTGAGSPSDLSGLLGSIGTTSKTQTFLQNALAQAGDPYVWGASAS